jgi:lauroyl/myristoyl acyltransferase
MRVFEDHIRAHPDQWLLWLRNWWRGRKKRKAA